jgi:dihydroorotate dehydrogenase (NAD+) catalytic subunit
MPARLFDLPVECPVGVAAGPLPNAKWIQAYARLGYGLLTYATVRSVARAAFSPPNLAFCHFGDPALTEPRMPRRIEPGGVTLAWSFGLPSAEPDAWRTDVRRAKGRLGATQLLSVSVAGTPVPEGDGDSLAQDYAECARWAAEAGADVIEVHLACPSSTVDHAPMVFEQPPLAAHVVQQVRRAVGTRPVVARLGSAQSPRALHELAGRLAPWIDGFVLVSSLQRRVVKRDGTPAFPGPGREVASISGAAVYEHCRVQVDELLAWRRAGAWSRVIFAEGGIATPARVRAALATGADAVLVGTAALADPLIAARSRTGR